MSSRNQLRRHYRRLRLALSAAARQAHAHSIARALLADGMLLRARTIGVYAAADGEPDLGVLVGRLWSMHRRVALPVVARATGRLVFFEHRPDARLVRGHFDIPVPPQSAVHVPLLAIDLLLMPLVAFDAVGTRLGMGGGYYDRTLAALPPGLRPHRVGIAHSCQQHQERLPHAHWDIPLDAVVTERGILKIHRMPQGARG